MLFSRQSEVQKWKIERNLKIWKSKMTAACDVIYLTIVAMETKVQMKLVICTKFQVNRTSCVESRRGGGGV